MKYHLASVLFIACGYGVQAKDLYLFAGQSNMVGHTTSGSSIGRNDALWTDVREILQQGNNATIMYADLYDTLYYPNLRDIDAIGAAEVAAKEAEELVSLYNYGLLNDLNTSTASGYCSFLDVNKDTGSTINRSGGTVPSNWAANCGRSFGHEWEFSRYLDKYKNITTNDFEAVKVASEGSQIHKHWYPEYGTIWGEVEKKIANKANEGNWMGFVWHQGTQETHASDEDTSITYLGNLTDLVERVRTDMFTETPGTWNCKEEIPAVIVQIGYWTQYTRSRIVRDAQFNFTQNDARAKMVVMNDTSRFFHFDAASFVIGGYRIAKALEDALQEPVTCPPPPTPSPTSSCSGDSCRKNSDCCSLHTCTGSGNQKTCVLPVLGPPVSPAPTPIQAPTPPPLSPVGCDLGQHGDTCDGDAQCCANKCKNSQCKGSLFE